LEWSVVKGSTLVGSEPRLQVLDYDGSGKHSSSLRYGNNYGLKKFYRTDLRFIFSLFKSVSIVQNCIF